MNKYLVLLLVIVLLTVSVSAQDTGWELTEAQEITLHSLMGTRFSINYPVGWFADDKGDVAVFNELEVDHQRAFEDPFSTEGYSISLGFLRSRGLRELLPASDRTLEDLLTANSAAYGYEDTTEATETSVLTWPALQVRTVDGMGNHIITIQGFYNEDKIEGIMFTLAAPSAEALDAFLFTWEAMLESITINEGTINLGGYRMYFECQGSGSPTVILEPDFGGSSGIWSSRALHGIAEFTQVCAHDRRAYGGELRTIQDCAVDTHDLLTIAGVEGPYVAVGPYVGGHFARVFAGSYPDEVVGLVLVDSLHPDGAMYRWEIISEVFSPEEIEEDRQRDIEAWARLGLDLETSMAQVAAVDSLGDMPLVVLTPELWGLGVLDRRLTMEIVERWHRVWTDELQPDLATLSANSTLIIIEGADHRSMLMQVEVIDAIRQMVEEVRAQED